jgi:cytochrome c oxidase subunit 2
LAQSATAAEAGAAPTGRTLFQAKGCSGCHALAGISSSQIGPNLTQLPDVAGRRKPGYSPEAYVRECILEPQAFVVSGYGSIEMPKLPVTDDEAEALVTFLLTTR